jgi:hypothetical protein
MALDYNSRTGEIREGTIMKEEPKPHDEIEATRSRHKRRRSPSSELSDSEELELKALLYQRRLERHKKARSGQEGGATPIVKEEKKDEGA